VAQPQTFKSGFVALAGRPNAGKSTLVNAVLGRKLAITSNTVQTTRHRFRAILNKPDAQLIIVDTPGIHKPVDTLGEELNRSAITALEDADLAAFVLDATQPFGRGDAWVLTRVKQAYEKQLSARGAMDIGAMDTGAADKDTVDTGAMDKGAANKEPPLYCNAGQAYETQPHAALAYTKPLLVITKAALAGPEAIQAQRAAAEAACPFSGVVLTSALEGQGVQEFVDACVRLLPEGPAWFPQDASTDQPLELLVAEFIREKILASTFDELPHAVGVAVEDMAYDEERNHYRLEAQIYVERESQKGMVVGKGGSKIKAIGSQARADLEQLLAASVYLDLRVKLAKNWRRDAYRVRRFGYGE
jgi:GTP-binding protein Era